MSNTSPTQDFPKIPFANAVANAIMCIICENVPALKGVNLKGDITTHAVKRAQDNFGDDTSLFGAAFTASQSAESAKNNNISSEALDDFQNKLSVAIAKEIKRQGEDFKYLDIYIRDPHETTPEWFKDIIDDVAKEQNLDLHSLMPYREKIAITVHKDGEIFWGTSGYGPATADQRVESYVGKPENHVPFINLSDIEPDTSQAYRLDLGHYTPIIVPDDLPQEDEEPNYWTDFRTTSISHQLHINKQKIGVLKFLKSLQKVWDDNNFDGHPDYRIAFVPNHLTNDLSDEDYLNIDVLRHLKNSLGTIMHSVWEGECPIIFTSPNQYNSNTPYFAPHFLDESHGIPFIDRGRRTSLSSSLPVDYLFLPTDDGFQLLSAPFYLSKVTTPMQMGVGRDNVRYDEHDLIAFTINNCAIGEYDPTFSKVTTFPKTAFPYLRTIDQIETPFNADPNRDFSDNVGHYYGGEMSAVAPSLNKVKTVAPKPRP